MMLTSAGTNGSKLRCVLLVSACVFVPTWFISAQQAVRKTASAGAHTSSVAETFATPKEAANALIAAAETFDVDALTKIFGPDGKDIVLTGETAQDKGQLPLYSVNRNSLCNFAVESPPTQTSNCSGSTTHFLTVGLQNCSWSGPSLKCTARFAPDPRVNLSNPFNCLTGLEALPAG